MQAQKRREEKESDCPTGAIYVPDRGACLPEMRETSEVYDQVEADQLLIVGRVSLDVHGELAYVAVSQGCVSGDLVDAPGGISLGKSAVCTIV